MKQPYRVISLTRGYVAVIDAKHYRRVNRYSWHTHMSKGTKKKPGQPYARATIDGKKIYLHRFITGAFSPMHVDHKNHQTLDYREENLKVCTHVENLKNRRYLKKPLDILMCNPHVNTTTDLSGESNSNNERLQNVAS